MGYLGFEVLDDIYMLQLVAIQHMIGTMGYASGLCSLLHICLGGTPSSMFFPRQSIYLDLSEMSCRLVHFSLLNRSRCHLQTSALLTSNYQLCHLCKTERGKGPVQRLEVHQEITGTQPEEAPSTRTDCERSLRKFFYPGVSLAVDAVHS